MKEKRKRISNNGAIRGKERMARGESKTTNKDV